MLSATSSGTPPQVARWLNKDTKKTAGGAEGRYRLDKGSIQFSATSATGRIDYAGRIEQNALVLDIYSHITRRRFSRTYRFVPLESH